MFNTQRPLAFACGALLLFAGCGSAVAQNGQMVDMPAPFATPVAPMQNLEPVITPVQPQVVNNPYLDTTLALQQQIAVLDKLLARERAISEMVTSYKRMGISYDAPKPQLALCESVPDNMSCALAYPERYAGFLPEPPPEPETVLSVAQIDPNDIPQSITELPEELALKELLWTDITCLKGICRAVITPDATNSKARYAIKVGDVLPPGGVVESISSTGVVISSGSTVITVPPAPTRSFTKRS